MSSALHSAACWVSAAQEFLCSEKRVALGPRRPENFFSVSWPAHRAELCCLVCSGNVTSVGCDVSISVLWSGLLHGGCFNGKTGQFFLPKTLLAAAQPSPYSLLLYSFDLFLIASKKSQTPPASYHPQAAHQAHSPGLNSPLIATLSVRHFQSV